MSEPARANRTVNANAVGNVMSATGFGRGFESLIYAVGSQGYNYSCGSWTHLYSDLCCTELWATGLYEFLDLVFPSGFRQ